MLLAELMQNAVIDLKSKYVLNEEEFKSLNYTDFLTFISDKNKCSKFVELVSSSFEIGQNKFKIMQRKERASHSVLTWILGVIINNNIGIINDYDYHASELLWLQTSVNHDYGYYLDEIKKEELRLSDITGKYDLLIDDYSENGLEIFKYIDNIRNKQYKSLFTYDPLTIINYFNYKKEWSINRKETDEINDHGIVGACVLFKSYCENAVSLSKKGVSLSITQMEIKKISCYSIASHNIFKSDNRKDDSLYEKHHLNNLTSTANKMITRNNKLLILLCLVDTIECYKTFTRKNYIGLNIKTILKSIDIEFEKNSITIDYSLLHRYIQKSRKEPEEKDKMVNVLKDHVNGICSLKEWTDLNTRKIDVFKVQITF